MLSDPIADLATRLRNAYAVGKEEVSCSHSKLAQKLVSILKENGYVDGFKVEGRIITIKLVYKGKKPAITKIIRVSRPGVRIYKNAGQIKRVLSGLGMSIISTSKGLMTDTQAREKKTGGEVIFEVW